MNKRKILVITQYFYPEQFRINDLCKRLISLGYEVKVLTGLPNYPHGVIYNGYLSISKWRENLEGIDVIRVPIISRGRSKIRIILNYATFAINSTLLSLFLSKDYDVIFSYQLSPVLSASAAVILRLIARRRLVLYCLDAWPISLDSIGINRDGVIYKTMELISKYIYINCDHIATTSKTHLSYLQNTFKIPEAKLSVIFQGVEAPRTFESHSSREFNVVYAGNMGVLQDTITLLRAAEELKETNIHWHIIGTGTEYKRCAELVREKNLDRVHLHGQQSISNLEAIMKASSIGIITAARGSEKEYPMPGKLQGYLAFGLPIVAAIEGEAAEFINDNEVGITCMSGDYRALSTAIKALSCSRDDLARYSRKAREVFDSHFSMEVSMESLIGIIEKSLAIQELT